MVELLYAEELEGLITEMRILADHSIQYRRRHCGWPGEDRLEEWAAALEVVDLPDHAEVVRAVVRFEGFSTEEWVDSIPSALRQGTMRIREERDLIASTVLSATYVGDLAVRTRALAVL